MTTNGLNGGAISTTTVRTGAASLRINPTATFSWMKQVLKSSASATEIFVQAYIRFATLPGSGQADIISIADTVGVTLQCLAKLDSADNKVKVYDGLGVLIGSSSACSTNTWYCLELHVIGGTGTATVEAKLDQSQFATSVVATVGNFDGFYLGSAFNSGTYDLFFDDVIANNTSGSNETSWVGGQSVIVLSPDSAGDANTFGTQTGGTAGAGNNFTRVNETTPNDATSFNGSSTLNQEDLFNMGACGLTSEVIKAVHIDLRFRNSTADATAVIKSEVLKTSGGTVAQSGGITPNATAWKTAATTTAFGHTQTTYADPDAAAWTAATLDSMQAGYKLTTGPGTAGRRIDVTKVWVTVSYSPASANNYTQTLSDTVTLTDTVLKQAGKALSDTTTITDAIVKQAIKVITETITHTDTVIRAMGRTLTDTVTISDTVLKQDGRTLLETVTHTDALVRTPGKVLTETVTYTDTIVRQIARTLTETITYTDTVLKQMMRALSETITYTDALTANKVTIKTLSETVTYTDVLTRIPGKVLTETATITDAILKQASKVLSEIITIFDADLLDQQNLTGGVGIGSGQTPTPQARSQGFKPTYNYLSAIAFKINSVGSKGMLVVIDNADANSKPTGTYQVGLYSFEITNAQLSTALKKFSLPTPLAVTANNQYAFYLVPWNTTTHAYADDYRDWDSSVGNPYANGKQAFYDSGSGTWGNNDSGNADSVFQTYGFNSGPLFTKQTTKVLSDTITYTDTVIRQIARVITETITITDTLLRQLSRVLTETVTLSDVVTKVAAKLLTLTETTTITDTLIRSTVKVLSETATITASITRQTSRLLTETVTITASIVRQAGRVLSETITVTDALVRMPAKVLQDTVTITGTLVKNFYKTLTESVTMSDTLTHLLGKVFSETITFTDVFLAQIFAPAKKGVTILRTSIERFVLKLSGKGNVTKLPTTKGKTIL